MANAMRTVSIRNLLAHKVRLVLTVVSVLLGTAFVAGSFIFTDTLQHSFHTIFDVSDKGIDARVQATKSYDPGVPVSLVPKIAAVDGVRVVQPNASLPLVVVNDRGTKIQPGGAPSEGSIWVPQSQSVSPIPTFVSGHAPTTSGQVVINKSAATKGKIALNQRVKLVLPRAGIVQATVVGIYHTSIDTGGYVGVLFSRQQGLNLLTDGTHYASLDIAAAPGVSETTLTRRIASTLPSDLEVKTGDQVRKDDQNAISSALSFINYFLLAFGIIALLVGTFIIYNTFSMIVAQRLRELALLRAVGASRQQVRRSVVVEAAVIGLIGSIAGIAGGIGLAYGLRAVLDALDLGLPAGGLQLLPRTIVVGLILGVGVTVLSALGPARRAGHTPPVAAMREEFAAQSQSSLRRRTIIATVLLALGAAATVGGVASSSASSAASLIGLGLLGVGAGALMLSPVLARWVIGPLGRVVGRPFGTVGRLARTNAVRNPRRTASTAFALTVGLLLVAGISVIGSSTKASIGRIFDTSVRADYILSSDIDVAVPTPAADAAGKVDGVASLTQIHDLEARFGPTHYSGTAVDGPLAAVLNVDFVSGGGTPTGTNALISKTVAKDRNLSVGSRVALSVPGKGSTTVTVRGVYKDNQLLGPWVVDGAIYRQLTPQNEWSDEVALVRLAPGADAKTVKAALVRVTDPYYVVQVQNRTEYKGAIASGVNGLLGLLYGLLGLAIVIAVLGIINTLALSVVERRREIGMLRAVGMQRKQVRRTIYVESLLIAVFGALLGLVLGLVYGALFTRTLRSQGLDVLSVPIGQSIAFLVLAAIVGVLAALWPGVRAARTRPLEAITGA